MPNSLASPAPRQSTPFQAERHRSLGFEETVRVGGKPVTVEMIETVLSRQIDDLEPTLMRHGQDLRILASQFNAKPPEIRELPDQMLEAGLPL
jgi:hypothetical protein